MSCYGSAKYLEEGSESLGDTGIPVLESAVQSRHPCLRLSEVLLKLYIYTVE